MSERESEREREPEKAKSFVRVFLQRFGWNLVEERRTRVREREREKEVRKKYCNGVAIGLGEFGARNSGFGVATHVGSWVWTEGGGETHRGGSWSL